MSSDGVSSVSCLLGALPRPLRNIPLVRLSSIFTIIVYEDKSNITKEGIMIIAYCSKFLTEVSISVKNTSYDEDKEFS